MVDAALKSNAAVVVEHAGESKIQILVPVYNEGEVIFELYKQLEKEGIYYDSLKFVYDFDGDTTIPFAEKLRARDDRVCLDKNLYGRGVINALKWGFAHAEPGPVIVVMGDNSDDLSIVPAMIRLWERGARVVCPSRYMKGGKQNGGGLVKSSLSRLACTSLKFFGFPTADATNNFKLYDGEWLGQQTIESIGGFEIGLELCYKAFSQGYDIKELPAVWTDRVEGESKFKVVSWLPHYLKWYFLSISAILKNLVRTPGVPAS